MQLRLGRAAVGLGPCPHAKRAHHLPIASYQGPSSSSSMVVLCAVKNNVSTCASNLRE